MANPIQSLNENFVYNSMLARALIQLLPNHEKATIRAWLDKLHQMEGSPDEMNNRNEYMWFLLLMLQNKKVTVPFNRSPPTGVLRPLRDILVCFFFPALFFLISLSNFTLSERCNVGIVNILCVSDFISWNFVNKLFSQRKKHFNVCWNFSRRKCTKTCWPLRIRICLGWSRWEVRPKGTEASTVLG